MIPHTDTNSSASSMDTIDQYMYHSLLIFDAIDGFPFGALLRGGNTHSSHGILKILKRLVKRLRKAYPKADIVLKADAGCTAPRFLGHKSELPHAATSFAFRACLRASQGVR